MLNVDRFWTIEIYDTGSESYWHHGISGMCVVLICLQSYPNEEVSAPLPDHRLSTGEQVMAPVHHYYMQSHHHGRPRHVSANGMHYSAVTDILVQTG